MSYLMFGISSSELMMIMVVCFLLLGPKKMAEMAYEAGKWVSKFKSQLKIIQETQIKPHLDDSVFYNAKTEMNQTLEQVKSQIRIADLKEITKPAVVEPVKPQPTLISEEKK